MARGNAQLALSIYGTMCRVGPGSSSATADRHREQLAWPPATLETVSAVVMGLARALRLRDAYSAIADVRRRGVPQGDEVPFGQVINSPMAAGAPLTVVHPHEGCRVVACASSRYEVEVFSGEVVRVESEALVQEQSLLLAAARTANLWRKQPLASVHQMVVRAPDGQARTFRFGTESADVPAQAGERVSIVCSPTERSAQSLQQGRFRPFGSGPPFTKPGQPLSATNHDTGREHALQPPPSSAAGIPSWVLPAAVLFSASDAASGDHLSQS
ncbi:g11164 [Coccomyxa viridis]|uniref:G11164 protein n=1 Tax=Coccomyxa viridis TaxID=1274662 RepID=A0ABP1G7I0_9CHLO